MTADGTGVVALAGSAAVRLLADRVGLTERCRRRWRGAGFVPVHDRGRVLVDVATILAAGGEAIADIDTLRHEPVWGPVASPATVWRALDADHPGGLNRIGTARAQVRRRVWALLPDGLPASPVAGTDLGDDRGARTSTPRWSPRTRRRSTRRRTSRAASGSIRSGCGATTPVRCSPSGCGRATRTPTTPATTSPFLPRRSARSRRRTVVSCWSGPTPPAPPTTAGLAHRAGPRSVAGGWSTRSGSLCTKGSRSTTPSAAAGGGVAGRARRRR